MLGSLASLAAINSEIHAFRDLTLTSSGKCSGTNNQFAFFERPERWLWRDLMLSLFSRKPPKECHIDDYALTADRDRPAELGKYEMTPEKRRRRDKLLLSGEEIKMDDLECLRRLGRFGTNYLARDKKSLLVVKLSDTITEDRLLERDREGHPFVVKLRSAFVSREKLLFVTEYYPSTLADALKSRRRSIVGTFFPVDAVRFFAAELLLGLQYLHERGVVHRNLKPANFWIDSHGHVAIADLPRCATRRQRKPLGNHNGGESPLAKATKVTTPFASCTVAYMAPEMLLGRMSSQGDWWSLGCSLYELHLGKTPFAAPTPKRLLQNILRKPSPSVEDPSFSALLRGLLVKDPARRFDAVRAQQTPFFNAIDWTKARTKLLQPPDVPILPSFILPSFADIAVVGKHTTSFSFPDVIPLDDYLQRHDDDDEGHSIPKTFPGPSGRACGISTIPHTPPPRVKLFRRFSDSVF